MSKADGAMLLSHSTQENPKWRGRRLYIARGGGLVVDSRYLPRFFRRNERVTVYHKHQVATTAETKSPN
jgi:hypothetical protein